MVSLQEAPQYIWMLAVIGIIGALGALILTEFNSSMDSTDTTRVNNETIAIVNADTEVVLTYSNINVDDFGNYGSVVVVNGTTATEAEQIAIGNYTVSSTGLTFGAGFYNSSAARVSYTYKYYNTKGNIISNSSFGILNMTKQLPTVGIVIGVALIVMIVVGLLVYFGMENRRY